jgi:hypothetical protein
LRRIIITGTAVAVLVAATAAYAAFNNTYTANFVFHGGAGSASKPVPVSFDQTYGANGTAGNRAAPLIDIKSTIYGLKADGKDFPKCTAAMINTGISSGMNDAICPKGSLIAQGSVTAQLGPSSSLAAPGSPCHPYLRVYNGGPGLQTYFFVVAPQAPPQYTCVTLKTGASAPYVGHVSQSHGSLVTDVPLPPDVSTKAGGLNGVYGSLVIEHLTWFKMSKRVHGKTVALTSSFACKHGKHPWSVQYTAVDNTGSTQTKTVTGSSSC